jgi:hypothetical protein
VLFKDELAEMLARNVRDEDALVFARSRAEAARDFVAALGSFLGRADTWEVLGETYVEGVRAPAGRVGIEADRVGRGG